MREKILIADDEFLIRRSLEGLSKKVYYIPATEKALQMGSPILGNMIMLGALWQATGIVSREAFEKAIIDSVPRGKDKLNLEAFARGARAVEEQIV